LRLKFAKKIAALSAVFTQLRTTTTSSTSATAGIFQADKLSFEVSTLNRILAEATQGSFVYFAKYFDNFNTADGSGAEDGAVFAFFKTLTDDASFAEDATTQFTKALNDIGVFTDDEVFAFAKQLNDTGRAIDARALNLQKPVAGNVASAEDETFVLAKKVKEDTAAVGEQINTRAFSKGLSDESPVIESFAAATGKPLSDNASAHDDEVVSTAKTVEDNVNVSDDVDGAANLDDDQELSVFKQITKTARVSEQLTRRVDFVRSFADEPTVADTPSLRVGRPVVDAAAVNANLFERAFTKTNLDNLVLTETLVVDSAKILYDTSSAADLKSLRVSTPHSDTSATTDVAFRAPTKVLTELVPSTDAGSLRSQGYADFTYFAEDYVGASRTF
jgi:hypothetical protein